MRPFLLQDRYQDEVKFVEKGPLALQLLLRFGVFDDTIDDEISDT